MLTKRERFANAITGNKVDRIPILFWLHFATDFADGGESARAHASFIRHYDWDMAKVVSDYRYPLPAGLETVETVADMGRITTQSMTHRTYHEQLKILRILRADLGDDWPVIDTMFDSIQQILRISGFSTFQLILNNPRDAKPMLEAVTETTLAYVRALKQNGVDGVFYSIRGAATEACPQGMEETAFNELMKPYDLAILEEMKGLVRIVHACKTHLDFNRVSDYPFEALSWWDRHPSCPSLAEVQSMRDTCVVGGLDQASLIEKSHPEIRAELKDAVAQTGGQKYIIAPGCTVTSNVPEHILSTLCSAVRDRDNLEAIPMAAG